MKPHVRGKIWYERDDKALKKALQSGKPKNEIAAQMGRSLRSIERRMATLGKTDREMRGFLTRKGWSTGDRERLLELHKEGRSVVEIATRMDRPAATIYNKLWESGLIGNKHVKLKEETKATGKPEIISELEWERIGGEFQQLSFEIGEVRHLVEIILGRLK